MKKIVFECETITPMFMYGADGTTPELRPASIKGVMRFWWRAINGNLLLDELKKQEGEIFGNTDKRSQLIIYPIKIAKNKDYKISLTPHHKRGYCSNKDSSKGCYFRGNTCMKANQKIGKLYTFTLKMAIKDNQYLNKEQLKNLFIIATTLGGFGQRSRRGFGSVQITKIDGSEVLTSPIVTYHKSTGNYPYIKNIQVGKTYKNHQSLLETTGSASHNNSCDDLGYARREGRLASPIYVSILKFADNDYRPIITTLNNIKSNFVDDFKKAIL